MIDKGYEPWADTLFTDPNDPTWSLIHFAKKALVMHRCADAINVSSREMLADEMLADEIHKKWSDASSDACRYCGAEPPPGFIALYKLYTWDDDE